MLVYRLCKEDEIRKIFCDKYLNRVGRYWENDEYLSSHHYDVCEKYLHFFLDLDSVFYLWTRVGLYICCYDIDAEIIKKYYGTGRYHNRENDNIIEEIPECAIPVKDLCFDNIVSVDSIDNFIEYEDYINGIYYDLVSTIYAKDQEKIKKKVLDYSI